MGVKTVSFEFGPGEYARLEKFLQETKFPSLEALLRTALFEFFENWPWDTGDICVYADQCMHRKPVDAWRMEQTKEEQK
jgi:hypothetical protein